MRKIFYAVALLLGTQISVAGNSFRTMTLSSYSFFSLSAGDVKSFDLEDVDANHFVEKIFVDVKTSDVSNASIGVFVNNRQVGTLFPYANSPGAFEVVIQKPTNRIEFRVFTGRRIEINNVIVVLGYSNRFSRQRSPAPVGPSQYVPSDRSYDDYQGAPADQGVLRLLNESEALLNELEPLIRIQDAPRVIAPALERIRTLQVNIRSGSRVDITSEMRAIRSSLDPVERKARTMVQVMDRNQRDLGFRLVKMVSEFQRY